MTWILKMRTENLVRQVFTNTGALDEKGYEIWKCSYCEIIIRRKPNSGWTNLYSHIQNRHASALEQVRQSAEASLAKGQTLMTTSFVMFFVLCTRAQTNPGPMLEVLTKITTYQVIFRT